ncbi:ABC transporter substrate-binding protein [Paenibacillus protaetiae]|uniref:Chorismate dehydratase n=2 Tax=Paenibacillus protaetiae TaxID=2509456 RepID=A0A4P6F024_9BACL|nr:ABC transporter substrate-binding protein [Paenibacillus protaetiae]
MGTRLETISVGQIDYANAWPIFHGLKLDRADISIVAKVPAELNRMLEDGQLQLSAVSSYAYAKNSDKLMLLPQLSVGTVGRVHSLFLFLKQPIDKAKPERIALTNASATTVNLLKIVMELHFDCHPAYETMPPDLDLMLANADGALLIGDPAIQASWNRQDLYRIDLGELWNQFTGLGMTYAVVAVNREAAANDPESIRYIHRLLLQNKRKNLADPDSMIRRACRELGGEESFWRTYFTELQYDFGPQLQAGLQLYCKYAEQLGLLEKHVQFDFFDAN